MSKDPRVNLCLIYCFKSSPIISCRKSDGRPMFDMYNHDRDIHLYINLRG